MKLSEATVGDKIQFPGRRKKFTVMGNCSKIVIRPGLSFNYSDGRNFDIVPAVRLKTSSGRFIEVENSKLITT